MSIQEMKFDQAKEWLENGSPELSVDVSLNLPGIEWLILHEIQRDGDLLRVKVSRQLSFGAEPIEMVCDLSCLAAVRRRESMEGQMSKILGRAYETEDSEIPF